MAYIEQRGKNYRVIWEVKKGEDRERRVESFDNWTEADQLCKKLNYEESIGLPIDLSKMKFGEYLDYYLKISKQDLGDKTYESYEMEIENHIKPYLGNIKLTKLKPLHLKSYYAFLREEGRADLLRRQIKVMETEYEIAIKDKSYPSRKRRDLRDKLKKAKARLDEMIADGKSGLSKTTVRYHHRIIHRSLNLAVMWQQVAINVAAVVDVPEGSNTEINYLNRTDAIRFIEAIKSSYLYEVFYEAIMTGKRQGEIFGTQWPDLNYGTGIIHVLRQLKRSKEKGYYYTDPKQHSKRDIPMPLPLQAMYRELRKKQDHYKTIFGDKYQDNNLVFCRPDGQPLYRSMVTRELKRILEENGFEHIRFHALRHTFATLARNAGMEISDLQDMLGHADIGTTKKMYVHKDPEPLRIGVKKLEEYLGV